MIIYINKYINTYINDYIYTCNKARARESGLITNDDEEEK